MNEVRLIDANALKANLPEPTTIKQNWVYRTLCDFIDNAPTVDLKDIYQEGHYDGQLEGYTKAINEERPQGEWKYICSYANTHLLRYECSKCGRTVDVYKRQELLVKYPFCHCGAEMKGGAE